MCVSSAFSIQVLTATNAAYCFFVSLQFIPLTVKMMAIPPETSRQDAMKSCFVAPYLRSDVRTPTQNRCKYELLLTATGGCPMNDGGLFPFT